jgi:hypothetical protein
MLDLKAKLAAAGLVSPTDIAASERKQKPPAKQTRPNAKPEKPAKPPPPKSGLDVPALRSASKGESYDAIRRAVDRQRLDVSALPPADAEPFHFTTARGQLSRLVLPPAIHRQLQSGEAGISAFMSHHGLAHAVVPRPLAEAIAELFPLWLRTLQGHPGAGQLEPKPPPKSPAPASPPDSDPENP